MAKDKKKLLLIGWDAADWKAIHPLMDAGLMPNLSKLVNEGVMGKLATLDPPLSPMLWTSISTGKRPYKHGILGFTEPKSDGSGIQPVLNTSRKCRAIWNILNNKGYKTNVVGWWPSHPAEPVNGTYISNFYQKAQMPKDSRSMKNWPLMDSVVHPVELHDIYARLRVHPWELTEQHLQPFIPNGAKLDQSDEMVKKLITALRTIIADCSSIHSAATYTMENTDWDFMAIYYDAIDHFGHGFMKFHPPRRSFVPEHLYEGFNNVVNAGYRYHDMILGSLMKIAGPETNIMLISDHGFHPDEMRPNGINRDIPAAPAVEHSPYGIIVASGPDFKKDHTVHGSSLIDMTPTILKLYDLPVGKDMDGRVLDDMFKENKSTEYIESWDSVEGDFWTYDPSEAKDSELDQEMLDQLVELGYIEKPDKDAAVAIKKSTDESKFWKAQAFVDGDLYGAAREIMEPLYAEYPDRERYGYLLIKIYRFLGESDKALDVLNTMRENIEKDTLSMKLLEARLNMMKGNHQEGIDQLLKIESTRKNHPSISIQLGNAYMRADDFGSAERSFLKAIKADPQSSSAYFGLGSLYFKEKKFGEAASNFVETIALNFDQAYAHMYLGQCLMKLDDKDGAAKAFSVALEMDSNLNQARQYLTDQKTKGELPEDIDVSSDFVYEKEIFIVSGLPRSGTSMMMQIFDQKGFVPFTDGKRKSDENNLKGYYEHEDIMRLRSNKKILNAIEDGQVVKIVAPLLRYIGPKTKFNIVFMSRDIEEILDSQKSMLKRIEKSGGETNTKRDTEKLKDSYQKLIEEVYNWADSRNNVNLINISHRECFTKPDKVADDLNKLLGKNRFIETDISKVVDPKLYREKIN